jgi:hypothetical protein
MRICNDRNDRIDNRQQYVVLSDWLVCVFVDSVFLQINPFSRVLSAQWHLAVGSCVIFEKTVDLVSSKIPDHRTLHSWLISSCHSLRVVISCAMLCYAMLCCIVFYIDALCCMLCVISCTALSCTILKWVWWAVLWHCVVWCGVLFFSQVLPML